MEKMNDSFIELGTEDTGKLLLKYAWPAIVAMVASSLYNMVDSIFIGQGVGALAISGLAVTFPLMNLGAAFGALVGVGASTLISVSMGQRNYEKAQNVFGNVIILNLIIGIAFSIFFLSFLTPILYFFGASNDTIQYAREYMIVILLGNVISHMYYGLNAIFRAAGHPRSAMIATIATVVLNTILDPIFIFVFDMGIRGAAIATVIAQTTALIWQLIQYNKKDELIHFKKGIYKLNKNIISGIISIGMSPFFMNVASCLVVVLINKALIRNGGDLAVGAYGIINRIAFIFLMIVMGITQGMQPIAGYNYGARRYDRVTEVLRKTIIFATLITTAGFLIAELIPRSVASIFTTDETLIDLAANGMKIVLLFFPIVGFQVVTTIFFQSIGMAKKSIFLSLTRQLLFLLPGVLILPNILGTKGVWWSMALSDLISTFTALVLLIYQFKSFKKTGSIS